MNDEDEDHEGSEEKECVICMDDFWYLPPSRHSPKAAEFHSRGN
jgi:hypothetical protein